MKYFPSHIIFTFFIFHFSFVILRVSSCSSSGKSASNQNVSNIYKSAQNFLHPKYAVFHKTNTSSELHFKINSKELLYSKQGEKENFTARFSIQYRLISSYETKDIIDSATVLLTDAFSNSPKDILGKLNFNATFTNSYLLEINFTDLNRNVTSKSFLNIDKQDHSTRQNFLVFSAETKTPVFRDNIGKEEHVLIRYRNSGVKVFVRYYHREFPLPSPPFSTANMIPFEYRADSLFSLQLNDNDTTGFNFRKPGFYHIQADTNTKDGLTLFRFDDDFPYVKKPEHLLQPLRYITSRQEYEAMSSYSNLKTAVDSFWLFAGGSHDRGRELVKKFYNRVQDANEYFSSYLEGWRTDRGLIYIIYGPPNIVYKSSDSENWVYGEENNFNSLTFTFLKVINPFSDSDYRLDRSQVFKTSWFNSVEMWRQGRIYAEK
ncbi:MAG: GWxTD domain-containing protein [Bacteroidetes bacterium]|nr:GWxTD domain-containing protein [Bacteroidota bacterium]